MRDGVPPSLCLTLQVVFILTLSMWSASTRPLSALELKSTITLSVARNIPTSPRELVSFNSWNRFSADKYLAYSVCFGKDYMYPLSITCHEYLIPFSDKVALIQLDFNLSLVMHFNKKRKVFVVNL
jgi:hypothetical protein